MPLIPPELPGLRAGLWEPTERCCHSTAVAVRQSRNTPPVHDDGWWDHPFILLAVERQDVGLLVRAWRLAHFPQAIPQTQVAKWLGTDQGSLSAIETGRRTATDAQRLAVFTTLKVPRHLWFSPD